MAIRRRVTGVARAVCFADGHRLHLLPAAVRPHWHRVGQLQGAHGVKVWQRRARPVLVGGRWHRGVPGVLPRLGDTAAAGVLRRRRHRHCRRRRRRHHTCEASPLSCIRACRAVVAQRFKGSALAKFPTRGVIYIVLSIPCLGSAATCMGGGVLVSCAGRDGTGRSAFSCPCLWSPCAVTPVHHWRREHPWRASRREEHSAVVRCVSFVATHCSRTGVVLTPVVFDVAQRVRGCCRASLRRSRATGSRRVVVLSA